MKMRCLTAVLAAGTCFLLSASPGSQALDIVALTLDRDIAAPGAAVTATITGTPGQRYALVGSSMGAGLSHAGRALSIGADFAILAMGTLDGSGQVAVAVTPPFLLTTLDRYYLQAVTSPSPSFVPIDLSPGRVVRNGDLVSGLVGPTGPAGPAGPTGIAGPDGAPGPSGSEGPAGATGATGSPGPGVPGATGVTGPTGPAGATAATGPAGLLGGGRAPFSIATVAPASARPAMTIGPDGFALISYEDTTANDLKVAHCTDAACTAFTSATLDSTGVVGSYPSIAIGTDGLGLISYYDTTNGDLKVAHCSNAACSAATTATVYSAGNAGQFTSIAIGTDGIALVSFSDVGIGLRVARCADPACSAATTALVDPTPFMPYSMIATSIAIGTDGFALVSYVDSLNQNLKVAHCTNAACTTFTTRTVDAVGGSTSIGIGADGLGLIAYAGGGAELKVAHCTDVACSASTGATLDSTILAFDWEGPALTIGSDGFGLIGYWRMDGLRVAHCADTACTAGTTAVVDPAATTGPTAITIGVDGLGMLGYATAGGLKVAHCSNLTCQPNVRRR